MTAPNENPTTDKVPTPTTEETPKTMTELFADNGQATVRSYDGTEMTAVAFAIAQHELHFDC